MHRSRTATCPGPADQMPDRLVWFRMKFPPLDLARASPSNDSSRGLSLQTFDVCAARRYALSRRTACAANADAKPQPAAEAIRHRPKGSKATMADKTAPTKHTALNWLNADTNK
jgi:hypothetical protein